MFRCIFFLRDLTLCHYEFFLAIHFCCEVAHVFTLNFSSIRTRNQSYLNDHIAFAWPDDAHMFCFWFRLWLNLVNLLNHYTENIQKLCSRARLSIFQRFLFRSKVSASFVFCVLFLLINCKSPPSFLLQVSTSFWNPCLFLVSVSLCSPYP